MTARDARGGPPFDAVLFDLFGTLIPTGLQRTRIENLREMGRILEVDPAQFADRWLASFDQRARGEFGSLEETIARISAGLGGHPSPSSVARAAEVRLGLSRKLLEAGQLSLSALDELRAAGVRLALVSDTSDDSVRGWPASALALRFEVTVFSCVERVRKPHPQMYSAALERLHLPPARCAFVGDGGSRELTGAEAVGLTAFQYLFPGEDPGAAYRLDTDEEWRGRRLHDLRELLPVRFARDR
jgi:putative hydrolase of the HAD superfamily